MPDRLKKKTAIVVGAGQTPGDTIGNGRAISLLFAREADITTAEACNAIVEAAKAKWGRFDILINNVGVGGRDGPAHALEEATRDRTMNINRKGRRPVIH